MKSGLDWFRIDVVFEDKFELVCAEFGSRAFEIIVRLWQRIYAVEGYYCEWNEEVALLFAKRHSLSGSVVSEIVKCCLRRGLFDNAKFEDFGILTSHGIQKWYFDSTERRINRKIVNDYLLISEPKNDVNVNKSEENVNRKGKNDPINEHSTVHNSTVHKRESVERKSNVSDESRARTVSEKEFDVPTLKEIEEYCVCEKLNVNAKKFFSHYEANGWRAGSSPMKSWRASLEKWSLTEKEFSSGASGGRTKGISQSKAREGLGNKYTKEQLEGVYTSIEDVEF